jgi:hypothetical protein
LGLLAHVSRCPPARGAGRAGSDFASSSSPMTERKAKNGTIVDAIASFADSLSAGLHWERCGTLLGYFTLIQG